jgi:hypothetical protein|tara:strand:- start:307 stop:1629 length:1323 start_codon:yes stop_codon:yes gene_type:complete|mmetsp:Transcript_6220/g.16786  ORF Transcript_6220/g.16786 Transcript_6220/m.16786 type:complete len:441 (+) Transcript_6220:186-1508(+)
MVARHGAEVIHAMDSTTVPLRGQNVGLSAPTPRHSVSHTQWTNGSPTGQMDDDEEDKYAKHAKVPSPRTPPEMPNGSRWGTRRASTTNGWGSRSPSRVHPTLSGKGAGRGRRKKRYPTLALLAVLMVLWVFAPAIHHVVTGVHKVFIRGYLFSIERPHHCLPSTPAPQDLADDDPIAALPPADLADLPGEIPLGRKPKVGIVSLCDHNVDAICAASVANKQAYADRHGYDVIVDSEIIDESRPTSWSKLLAMRKYLPYYDYLFYVDVDTIVANVDVKLEDIVDYGYDQILAADRNGLNCGVWLIRNTPWSLWFLDEMWAQEQLVAPSTRVLFHYEQRAMHYLYQSRVWRRAVKGEPYKGANTVRARTKVVNTCVFNSLPAWYVKGDFIVHLAGLKGIAKCLAFRHYYGTARREISEKYGALTDEANVEPPTLTTCLFGRI